MNLLEHIVIYRRDVVDYSRTKANHYLEIRLSKEGRGLTEMITLRHEIIACVDATAEFVMDGEFLYDFSIMPARKQNKKEEVENVYTEEF